MKQSENVITIFYCSAAHSLLWHYLTCFHSRTSKILPCKCQHCLFLDPGLLLLFYLGGHWFAGWWHRWHQNPCLTTSQRHFTCIMKWFGIIVKQQNLIMTASFPCVLITKTPNILWNLDIKLPWRNRLGFEDIRL